MRIITCDYKDCDEQKIVPVSGVMPSNWAQFIISRIKNRIHTNAELNFCKEHSPNIAMKAEDDTRELEDMF